MVFDEQYGLVLSRERKQAISHGNHVHDRIYRCGHKLTSSDRRCFIASAVFGVDAEETVLLRQFRDRKLLPCCAGRWMVLLYYKVSPTIAMFLKEHSVCAAVVRQLLVLLIRGLRL